MRLKITPVCGQSTRLRNSHGTEPRLGASASGLGESRDLAEPCPLPQSSCVEGGVGSSASLVQGWGPGGARSAGSVLGVREVLCAERAMSGEVSRAAQALGSQGSGRWGWSP